MTDRLSTLTRLRDMVRNADGPDMKLDAWLCETFDLPECHEPDCLPDVFRRIIARVKAGGEDSDIERYSASLDAAIDLTERILPGAQIGTQDVALRPRRAANIRIQGFDAAAYGNTRPLAILDCLLSVLIEKEERDAD